MAARTASFSLSPTVKRKWLAALRSGKYKQGSSFMYNKSVTDNLGLLNVALVHCREVLQYLSK